MAASKQVLGGTLRSANATQAEMQSDDYRHSLWLPHHRASVWRTASFWIKMWFENNDFCSFWDTVCTITALFQQDVASRRQHCAGRLVFFSQSALEISPPTFFLFVTVNTWLLIVSFHLQRQRWFVPTALASVLLWLWSIGLSACVQEQHAASHPSLVWCGSVFRKLRIIIQWILSIIAACSQHE